MTAVERATTVTFERDFKPKVLATGGGIFNMEPLKGHYGEVISAVSKSLGEDWEVKIERDHLVVEKNT